MKLYSIWHRKSPGYYVSAHLRVGIVASFDGGWDVTEVHPPDNSVIRSQLVARLRKAKALGERWMTE